MLSTMLDVWWTWLFSISLFLSVELVVGSLKSSTSPSSFQRSADNLVIRSRSIIHATDLILLVVKSLSRCPAFECHMLCPGIPNVLQTRPSMVTRGSRCLSSRAKYYRLSRNMQRDLGSLPAMISCPPPKNNSYPTPQTVLPRQTTETQDPSPPSEARCSAPV